MLMILVGVVQQVECIKSCGVTEPSTVAAIGLVVAFASLALAIYAIRLTSRSVGIAKDALGIAQEQHRVFLRDELARARLTIEIGIAGSGSDGVRRVEAGVKTALRVDLGFSNIGERQARNVVINWLFPQYLEGPRWVDGNGGEVGPYDLQSTSEKLSGTHGELLTANYLEKRVDLIDLSANYIQRFRFFAILKGASYIEVPTRLRVSSDDFPDDSREYIVDELLRIEAD
jgi:hypothetical protein